MRLLYSLAWWIALPLVLLRLWWRGRKEPGYRQDLAERFGFYPRATRSDSATNTPTIWVHAVSVGETRAAEPLITALLDRYSDHRIVLTHMTATGRATGAELFGKHGTRVVQSYFPYDTGWMVGRFLHHYQPQVCVLMETEVWPNAIAQCRRHQVPVALVNARLSERSLAKAHRLSALMTEAARNITCVAAQTEADAERIRQLGALDVHVTGSIKFDIKPPPQMLERGMGLHSQIGARPVLLCASTREGEEKLILDAFTRADVGNTLLLLVPRHPQRFDEVAGEVTASGLRLQRRSLLKRDALASDVQVLLGDSMGEMFAYYAASDVAFIGGSLLPLGGQNLIEACSVGRPALIGPHTFNFAAVSEDAVAEGAALRVDDAAQMVEAALRLLGDHEQRTKIGMRAYDFAKHHRGATMRTVVLLRNLIN